VSTETKLKLLLGFSLLCLMGLLLQGYLLWQVQAQLVSDSENLTALPQSIEERLDAALNSAGAGNRPSQLSPFGRLNQPPRVDPFSQLQQQLDSMFDVFSAPSSIGLGSLGTAASIPQLFLTETDTEYQVKVATAPDTDVEISTELEANLLIVRGSVTNNLSDTGSAGSSNFVSRSQFTRAFDLPKPVDELGVFTEPTNNGLLIHVPIRSAKKP
jgi:HSP20 family molecular chaperone IbpA